MTERSHIAYNKNKNGKLSSGFSDHTLLKIVTEVGLNFFRFMKGFGISEESKLVVLSPKDDWGCSKDELRKAEILVNRRKLNLIKHLDLFLGALVRTLPPDIRFIGCFSEKGSSLTHSFGRVDVISKILRFLRLSGWKGHSINRSDVMELLEKNGFTTIGMRNINGLTYFISSNTAPVV